MAFGPLVSNAAGTEGLKSAGIGGGGIDTGMIMQMLPAILSMAGGSGQTPPPQPVALPPAGNGGNMSMIQSALGMSNKGAQGIPGLRR